jgi:hypothetical protein
VPRAKPAPAGGVSCCHISEISLLPPGPSFGIIAVVHSSQVTPLIAFLLAQVTVAEEATPFIGCESFTQLEPLDPPRGKTPAIRLTPAVNRRIAYYKAEVSYGVVAPRGWHCLGTWDSSGRGLLVSPEPIDTKQGYASVRRSFAGPGIEMERFSSGTSGSYDIAEFMMRVFPSFRATARRMLDSVELPIPSGPYPADKIRYRGARLVEYETPPQADGFGSRNFLVKNSLPIRGFAMLLSDPPDLLFLAVRLPSESEDLAPVIIRQLEDEASKHPRRWRP